MLCALDTIVANRKPPVLSAAASKAITICSEQAFFNSLSWNKNLDLLCFPCKYLTSTVSSGIEKYVYGLTSRYCDLKRKLEEFQISIIDGPVILTRKDVIARFASNRVDESVMEDILDHYCDVYTQEEIGALLRIVPNETVRVDEFIGMLRLTSRRRNEFDSADDHSLRNEYDSEQFKSTYQGFCSCFFGTNDRSYKPVSFYFEVRTNAVYHVEFMNDDSNKSIKCVISHSGLHQVPVSNKTTRILLTVRRGDVLFTIKIDPSARIQQAIGSELEIRYTDASEPQDDGIAYELADYFVYYTVKLGDNYLPIHSIACALLSMNPVTSKLALCEVMLQFFCLETIQYIAPVVQTLRNMYHSYPLTTEESESVASLLSTVQDKLTSYFSPFDRVKYITSLCFLSDESIEKQIDDGARYVASMIDFTKDLNDIAIDVISICKELSDSEIHRRIISKSNILRDCLKLAINYDVLELWRENSLCVEEEDWICDWINKKKDQMCEMVKNIINQETYTPVKEYGPSSSVYELSQVINAFYKIRDKFPNELNHLFDPTPAIKIYVDHQNSTIKHCINMFKTAQTTNWRSLFVAFSNNYETLRTWSEAKGMFSPNATLEMFFEDICLQIRFTTFSKIVRKKSVFSRNIHKYTFRPDFKKNITQIQNFTQKTIEGVIVNASRYTTDDLLIKILRRFLERLDTAIVTIMYDIIPFKQDKKVILVHFYLRTLESLLSKSERIISILHGTDPDEYLLGLETLNHCIDLPSSELMDLYSRTTVESQRKAIIVILNHHRGKKKVNSFVRKLKIKRRRGKCRFH